MWILGGKVVELFCSLYGVLTGTSTIGYKAPGSCMVYICICYYICISALKCLPFQNFGVYVCTMKLHGAFGIVARTEPS